MPSPGPDKRKRTLARIEEWNGLDEIQLLRHFCREDFWTFFLYAFGAGLNPKGRDWIEREVHEPMAKWFQKHVEEWESRRGKHPKTSTNLAIVVHRGVGKTTKITRAGQLWLHLRHPDLSSYTGAENTLLSGKMLRAIKAVMDGSDRSALWPRLYGDWSSSASTWTGKEVVHAARGNTSRQDPSLGIFGVETSITGAHPDAIFYDDPISYERLSTDSNWLATVNSQVSSLIPVLQSDGLLVWVGTRYDDDDHFGVAFRSEGIASLAGIETDALKVEDGGKWHVYFLAGRDKQGVPTTPKVWPDGELKRYQKRDPLRYAAQVLNDPSVSEMNPLSREQLDQATVEQSKVPWGSLRYAILCDFAFAEGEKIIGKDETTYYLVGYPKDGTGDIYACEGDASNSWRAEDMLRRIVAVTQRYRRKGLRIFAITYEQEMGGLKGTWRMNLQNYFSDVNEPLPTVYTFSRGGQKKEQRLVAAANYIVDGHVRFVKGAPGIEELKSQLLRIGQYMATKKVKIDRADAFSDAFQPELYSPMRRQGVKQAAPWEKATVVGIGGINPDDWQQHDSENQWEHEHPRPPIRS